MKHTALTLAIVFVALVGCAKLGYRNRVLHRVPSPDATMVAVCQEMPEFDGPSYDVRLERPDGTVVRRLYVIGDGYPCDEMVWSSDGRTLAVLSSPVANAWFVDVAWALAQPAGTPLRYWHWRRVSLAWGEPFRFASALRFAGEREVEYQICPYSLDERRRTGEYRCTAPAETRRLRTPPARAASGVSSQTTTPRSVLTERLVRTSATQRHTSAIAVPQATTHSSSNP